MNCDYSLYLVTDSDLCPGAELPAVIQGAIEGGVTVVQVREKDASTRAFYQTALQIKKITDAYHVPLIINDRLDIAQAIDADGLHIGQSDLPAPIARKILGKDKLLGISVGSLAEAEEAVRAGADYLGVGTVFPTSTKDDAELITADEIKQIRKSIQLPLVAIGGIKANKLTELKPFAFDGIAVVSAIIGQPDPKAAALALKKGWVKQ